MKMKLTDENKKKLAAWGYRYPAELAQIEAAMSEKKTNYTIVKGQREREIKRSEALQLLGEEIFLSGIARSAFHFTAARETADGKTTILFDSSKLLR